MYCHDLKTIKVYPRDYKNNRGETFSGYHIARVPCGKCPACFARRADELAQRLLFESEAWPEVLVVCWTYSPDNRPTNGSLSKLDAQKMLHNLKNKFNSVYGVWKDKKLITPFKWKYFLSGEYGEKEERDHAPHYHALLFLPKAVDWHFIHDCNTLGNICDISRLRGEGAAYYVAKYTLKEVLGGYTAEGKEPPFYLQSNGIGKSFLESRSGIALRLSKDYRYRDAGGYMHHLGKYLRYKMFDVAERHDISEVLAEYFDKRRPKNKQDLKDDNLRIYNDILKQENYQNNFKNQLKSSLL